MKIFVSFIAVFFFLNSVLFAQTLHLKGKVSFSDIETSFVYNLLVYAADTDTTLVLGRSLFKRVFELKIPKHKHYIIQFSSLGYNPIQKKVDFKNQDCLNLGEVRFTSATYKLDGVTVTAKQPMVKRKSNKLLVHVKNTILGSSGNVAEMLARTPGLMKNGLNSIVVPGRGTPLIIIDGRKIKQKDILQSLRASDIESLEIDRKPSSEYSASVRAVIRIKTIERLKDNSYMQISNAAYQRRRFSNRSSIYFRVKRGILSSMVNYYYDNTKNLIKENYYRYIYHTNNTFSSLSKAKIKNNFSTHALLAAADLSIHSKQKISFQYYYKNDIYRKKIDNKNKITDKNTFKRQINQNKKTSNRNHSLSLNYHYTLNKENSLVFITDYAWLNSNSNEATKEENESSGEKTKVDVTNNNEYKVYTALGKYKFKLPYSIYTKIGVEYAYVDNFSTVKTADMRQNENPSFQNIQLDNQRTAAYFTFNKAWDKFHCNVGLRYEYEQAEIKLSKQNKIRRIYSDFFPNLEITYAVHRDLSFSLTYSKYVSRPQFRELNPNVSYEDAYSYVCGNPSVKPEFHYEVGWSLNWKSFSFSFDYTKIRDFRTQTVISDEKNPNITKLIPINIGHASSYSAQVSYALNKNKFSLYSSLGAELPNQEIPYLNGIKRVNKLSWNFSLNIDYSFNKKFAMYSNFFYNAANESMITYQYATHGWDIGFKGYLLKKRLILNLYATDLLRGNRFNNLYDRYMNIKSGTDGKSNSRGIGLRLTYVLFRSKAFSIDAKRGNKNILQRIK